MSVHFSSATDQWATPQELYDRWDRLFCFDLDACADEGNAKCQRFYSVEVDGLAQEWAPHRVWLNPPYGRSIGRWMAKAKQESARGALVVALVPARTDTRWWHDHVVGAAHIIYLQGRVRFGTATAGAPFPSAIVIYYPQMNYHS